MLQEIKAKVKDEHREDLQGYLLNLFLQSQNPSLQRPLQRRERRDPKGKRGKLMLAGMRITLQKMELTKQTRHIKLKVLEMPSEGYAFLFPWIARKSNQSMRNEISPEYSLAGLMLKLKLQYFGHLIRRTDLF